MTASVELSDRYEVAEAALQPGDFRAVFSDDTFRTLGAHYTALPAHRRVYRVVSAIAGTDPSNATRDSIHDAAVEEVVYDAAQLGYRQGVAFAAAHLLTEATAGAAA